MQDTKPNASLFEDTQLAFSHKSDSELKKSYRLFQTFNHPLFLLVGKGLTNLVFQLKLPVEKILKKTIYSQFCGGETLEECKEAIQQLAEHHISTALQYSVETKASEDEYNQTTRQLVEAINYSQVNPNIKAISCKLTGIGSIALFERLHGSSPLMEGDKEAFDQVRKRMETLCSAAEKAGVAVFFDAEESWIQRPMDELIDEMILKYNRNRAIVYNTFQLYRTDRLEYLKMSFQKAKANNVLLGAKLVRGAYMEKERERADQRGYPSPIYSDKTSVDKAYNQAVGFCLDNVDRISFCAATHNEQSCLHLTGLIDERGIQRNHPHIFFSQLYGMGEHLTYNLAREGFKATKLVPYGPVMETVPYLIRRAEENSSLTGQVGRELQLLRKEMKRRGLIK